ncbi:MAG: 3-hydroxyacyl-CoA dehydrogenase NAD-binding domain-containing protein [Flavobacteriales bacterium]
MKIGITGAGAMGTGIAQVVAQSGSHVVLHDLSSEAVERAQKNLHSTWSKLVEKGKISAEELDEFASKITFTDRRSELSGCQLIIEAIIENLDIKRKIFQELEELVSEDCILATNTSSLSVSAIASACQNPSRVLGIHFFNPAPLMPLVEIIPALQTHEDVVRQTRERVADWKKVGVVCKDTPGFIVNRVARPFYSEALRILDEGMADASTIDQSMRDLGFRMGPFELMDLIGHDVNYAVTESVFAAMYFDPRFKPSMTQKKLTEAGWLGRKTNRGFFQYQDGQRVHDTPVNQQNALSKEISERILVMLINEAYDTWHWNIASAEDIDLAMTKGVNYPKGLITWGQELGLNHVISTLQKLYDTYQEDRYRTSMGLRKAVSNH